MRRWLSLIMFFGVALAIANASTIDINGTAYRVDTLDHYQVGPGTYYTRFDVRMGTTVHHLYQLDADLTNPYLKVEECQSGDQIGALERMDDAHLRLDSVGHHPIGSVNCNFWYVSTQTVGNNEGLLGQPFAGTAKDGMLIGEPESWNSGHGDRGFVMIDDLGHALIRNLEYKGRVYKGGSSAAIREVNRNRVHPNSNEIALFNRYCGAVTRAIPDTAIEVVFDAVSGWAINDTMTCVVVALDTTGGVALTGNMGAMQARGARGNWCRNHLAVGDTFQIKLGVYSTSLTSDDDYSADSIAPHVMQMVTGNGLVMANGQLTSRNNNETYNNQNYPRTMLATNDEGTHFWMLVSEKPGNYTAEMCGILRNNGATWAAGMDGGGSAQFNLLGKILNPTTEAYPRAVANSMFMICVAPETDEMERIERVVDTSVVVATYTRYTPALRIYNQYGRLMPPDYPYTLSVSPATLGTITEDGLTFIAGSTKGNGTLTVTSGGASLDIPITLVNASMQMRMDTILTDHRPYLLEVLAGIDNPVPADVLAWTSDDETVATVDNGVITGVHNGETTLQGVLDDQWLTECVRVEIPTQQRMAWELLGEETGTQLDASKGFNPTLTMQDSLTYSLNFTYSVVRSAYVRFSTNRTLYSLPDSVVFYIKTNADISRLRIYGRAHHVIDKEVFAADPLLPGEWNRVAVPVSAWLSDPSDRMSYPVHFLGMEFALDSKTQVGDCNILISQMELVYSDWPQTSDGLLYPSDSSINKYIEAGRLIILKNGVRYSVLGVRIM